MTISLIIAILLAPAIIFDCGFLQPIPALFAACSTSVAIVLFIAKLRAEPLHDPLLLAGCLVVGLAVCLVGGHGHLFYQTDDWVTRDSLFLDLIRQPWPVSYEDEGRTVLLRAPLGMYLLPALVGKVAGPAIADALLAVQNSLLLGLLLYGFARLAKQPRDRWPIVVIFVLFSGVDVLPWFIQHLKGREEHILPHIDDWAGFFQFSSHITQMFWVPMHALAGWAFTLSYFLWRDGRLDALGLGVVFSLCMLWSPLAMAGALPLLIFALLTDWIRGDLKWPLLLPPALAGLGALPAVIYLTRDAASVDSEWVVGKPGFGLVYIAFLGFEVLPFIYFLWQDHLQQSRFDRLELGLLAGLFAVLPLYSIGIGNDIAMRCSIPALAVLCVRFGLAFPAEWRKGLEGRRWIIGAVVLAAATPGVEIARNLTQNATPASTCNFLDAHRSGPYRGTSLNHYLADTASFDAIPRLFKQPTGPAVQAEGRYCWDGSSRQFIIAQPPRKRTD